MEEYRRRGYVLDVCFLGILLLAGEDKRGKPAIANSVENKVLSVTVEYNVFVLYFVLY